MKFVESMTREQFEQVGRFFLNTPHLNKEVSMKCVGCGEEVDIEFKGLRDFFT